MVIEAFLSQAGLEHETQRRAETMDGLRWVIEMWILG